MNRKPYRWLGVAGVALLAAACAQSNGDINRVQPNVIRKADLLDGEWYVRNFVNKAPATSGFTFVGELGKLEKVVWEIQQDQLIAYRSYSLVPGSDPTVDPGSKPSGTTQKVCDTDGKCVGGHKYFGSPLMVFSIKSHFDIQRNYNAATGETGNVIAENASDRPWNEREYMRVDWSQNHLNVFAGMNFFTTVSNPMGYSDGSSFINANEPNTDPYDWPTFEHDGNGKLKYFDYTARYYASPDTVCDPDYGCYSVCMLMGGFRYDCTAAEIHMRTSIAKVDPNKVNDYEPLVYDNFVNQKFGIYRIERPNYDRKFGATESGMIYLASRFRTWESYYEKDAEGRPDQTRPIAMANRTPKPIVYYVSPASRTGGPTVYKQYLEMARVLEKNWDKAFRRATAAAQGKNPDQVPQMLYVCENPVTATDTVTGEPVSAERLAACGNPGFEAKQGDLRYSFLNTIVEPTPNGLLGYGPMSADPETGETISANASQYTGAVDSQAQFVVDIIDLLTNAKTIDQHIRGTDVQAYMAQNRSYLDSRARQNSKGQLQSELQGVLRTGEETRGAYQRPSEYTQSVLQKLRQSGGLHRASGDPVVAAAEQLAQHPQLESAILDNPDVQKDLEAFIPARVPMPTDRAKVRQLARKTLTRLTEQTRFEAKQADWASSRNIMLASFTDRQMMGYALKEHQKREVRIIELKKEGKSEAEAKRIATGEIRRRAQQNVWLATALHEIGHNFGLRHNFQGSFDAVNYHDKFWELKQPTLTVEQNGSPVIPRTPGDLKTVSDGTENQQFAGVHDFEYSSIMDYHGAPNGDFQGIGKYDEAAILFTYSGGKEPGYVEVFESARKDPMSFPGSDGKTMTITGAGYDLPLVNASRRSLAQRNYTERFHYSTVPMHFGQGGDLETVIADGIRKLQRRKLMKWADVKKENDRLYNLLKNNPTPAAADVGSAPLEVPYMYCSDGERENSGYPGVRPILSCNWFDRGPDYYEQARTTIEDYWRFYYFTHFKRDRYYFSSNGAFNNAMSTFSRLSSYYKHWVHGMYGASADQQNLGTQTADPLIQDYLTMAVMDATNANLAVMSVPPAGLYMYRAFGNGAAQWDVISEGDDFDNLTAEGTRKYQEYYGNTQRFGSQAAQRFVILDRGLGRRMYSRYDFRSGFGFWFRMLEAGHYNDQMGAMFAAVMPEAQFFGADSMADQNRYYIPYYLMFKDEFGKMFGSLWSMDESVPRPTMYLTKNEQGAVTDVPTLGFRDHVNGAKFVQDFTYPKPLASTLQTLDPAQFAAPANIQLTWTSRIYSLYLGMAMFRVNYDLDYAKQNQVLKLGGGETVTPGPGYHLREVEDFTTGARYAALEKDSECAADVKTGPTCPMPNSSPAIRMINTARDLLDVVRNPGQVLSEQERRDPAVVEQTRKQYTEYFKDQVRDLDLMRGMFNVYGKAF